ncbi:unnamed protein product [Adineta steineri]|uniref:PLAT domain-containing protein n=2 Tax=Adineta steineri TaxID=433720 RepID=A0A815A6L1_9BILA|nr:unnamed protein product [Adineta steineri]
MKNSLLIFFSKLGCYAPTVTLIPGQSSLPSPMSYRRSQDFSISSMIQFNCNGSLSTTKKWTIKNCTSICSFQIQLNDKISTTLNELYIPSRTLDYGIYELTLTVTMIESLNLKSSSSAYVRITATGITANLVQLGTSMITRGSQQDLQLNPGAYSVDPDQHSFDASKWKYTYYCRIYGLYNFPNFQGILLPIENSKTDPYNPSCLSNQSGLIFGNLTTSPSSSLAILGGSLQSNQMYQFMVYMENRKNSSIQATGYVLVTVDDTHPQLIVIGCVISILCVPNLEYQFVNPTTQVALFAICVGNCINLQNIKWNIYQGSDNSSSNYTQWTLFNNTVLYENIWFFGKNTSNFTATNQLFLNNPQINLWRFEVVYTFLNETSTSALNFIINQPPDNGSCSVNPMNGTTTTLFTILCPGWFDEDGIKDYSLYAWTTDVSQKLMIAYSSVSSFQVRLPSGDNQTSLLNIAISIRDLLDCVVEVNMSSVYVIVDSVGINDLMTSLQSSPNTLTNNPIVQLLSSGNQNTVGQILTAISQQFNQLNSENIDQAISSGIPAATILVSSLGSSSLQGNSTSFNESALIEYNKILNTQANLRDYLMTFTTNLLITTSNSIKLQSSSLAQITQSTNQLTRAALSIASNRCYQLSLALSSMATQIPYEDAQIAANQLIQCASNVLTAVNGPLQERTSTLDLDYSRANAVPTDYDTDLESPWSNTNLFGGGDEASVEKNRNIYYQKQLANEINSQVTSIISLITSSLNIHLNIGQNSIINTSQTYMSLETISTDSLSNKIVKQIGNAQFHIPSDINLNTNDNSSISLRSKMDVLASFGSFSNTNLSRSISLSIIDQNGDEISFKVNENNSIKLIIPRDPNLLISSMYLQNVTSINSTINNLLFNYHYINITSSLPISVHFEIHSLNTNLAYLFIYKFDQTPQLNSSINLIDGWTMFCPFNLTNDDVYRYFIDNQQTPGHQSLIFGIRELNSTEMNNYCLNNSSINTSLPITDEPFNFTSNYELRIYTSGCYYLDENNNWKSDGLIVGSLTNHYETECLSTHLTSFAGGFIVLPEPINWSYVFANAGFLKNKTIYLTVICMSIAYIILMIFGRFKDKEDIEKLGVTPLADNNKSDQYYYQIIVFTGQRANSGTQSKVHFILSSDNDETRVRTFSDPHRKIFQRGGIDSFIMSVPKSLGLLNYIRIWHDNSGEGSSASWFLKYIIVRDLQTMEKFYFIAQRWFSVEQGDGLIERILPIAGEMEKQNFSYVLSKKAYFSVSDGHLWFSIFSRPPSNKFTRVQRCTCCFVLLFASMLLNIMYYDLSAEAKSTNNTESNSLSIGPLYIAPEQIGIGIMVELFSLVPSIFIVQFFRRIRPRRQISPLRQVLEKIRSLPPTNSRDKTIIKNKKSQFTFPWWCLFIAYTLSFMIIAVSIFFIIVKGIIFGDLKTQKWLTSVLTGFFSSIILTQPIKILGLAVFFTLFCRNPNDDKEAKEYIDETNFALDGDEDYLHSNDFSLLSHSSKRITRLNENEVAFLREQRLKELQMWSIIREFMIYAIFLILLCIISFLNRTQSSFYQTDHLQKYFLNTRQTDCDYTQILTIDDYWNWLNNSFISNLRAQQWYNDDQPINLNGYINDKTNRMIGWATMRQVRSKSQLCSDQRIISRCIEDYSLFNEEKDSFQPGWTLNQTSTEEEEEDYSSSILKAFQYQSSKELDTYAYVGDYGTYSGDGYVYEFRGRLSDIKRIIFGDLKTQQWLTSVLTGFFSSIILTQPIKILGLAVFFTLFCRNPNDDKEAKEYIDETNFELDGDEDYLHSNNFSLISNSSKRITRLNENEVAFLREQRLKEIQMWSIIREFIIYAIFLALLFVIAFLNGTQNSFYQTDHLQKYFLNTRQTDCDYTQILTIDDYWNWLNNSFVDNLRAQQWYNDDQPINLNGYINDKTNRMIGWATMRQLRSKSQLCCDQRIISTCINDYSLFNEEKDSFQPGWILNQTSIEEEEDYSSSILKAFQYQSSKELDTYAYEGDHGTYSGDGYVYEFRGRLSDIKSNLSKLHQLQWIDANTRAVIIQLNLYNPNVALFTSVTFLLEFLSASGVYPSARFEPLNFYVFTSLTQLICTIIYICFIIYFLIIEIKLLSKLQLKYFYEFWSIIQLGIISCSITSIIIYIWRFKEYNRLSSLFLETNGYVYVNLQMIAYVDDVLTSLLGFCCFFGTIKFIKFIRFNKSLIIFVQTLKYVTKDIISFSFMFSIVFMAFLSLFYLLFTSSIASCSSLLSTAQMLFEITLMSFDATDFTGADPFLGPFCFSLFIIIVVFVCLSMFISILNDGFHHVEETPVEDQQILSYMLKKFLNWTHLRKPNVEELYEIQDSRMRSQYVDPIENFPDKIDQLLDAINRVYIDQKKELLKLKRAGV